MSGADVGACAGMCVQAVDGALGGQHRGDGAGAHRGGGNARRAGHGGGDLRVPRGAAERPARVPQPAEQVRRLRLARLTAAAAGAVPVQTL